MSHVRLFIPWLYGASQGGTAPADEDASFSIQGLDAPRRPAPSEE